jgi:hypothetical protein
VRQVNTHALLGVLVIGIFCGLALLGLKEIMHNCESAQAVVRSLAKESFSCVDHRLNEFRELSSHHEILLLGRLNLGFRIKVVPVWVVRKKVEPNVGSLSDVVPGVNIGASPDRLSQSQDLVLLDVARISGRRQPDRA